MHSRILGFLIFLFFGICTQRANAQHDSAYYTAYYNDITTRFYFSRKYTALNIRDRASNYTLKYRPNTTLNMGVGATYRWATLNLAYGFGFLNPNQGKGDTQYLDLQFHRYGQKLLIDVFGQFYKGFYLIPKSYATMPDQYYKRPDLDVLEIGTSVQYVFNNKQFSYNAVYLQNAWQQKTAGTFLLGFEGYYGRILADSTIVPTAVDSPTASENYDNLHFYQFGPNLGYAYTLVINRHYFFTGSFAISLNYGRNSLYGDVQSIKSSGVSSNSIIRLFAGYNSRIWSVNVVYLNNSVNLANRHFEHSFTLNTGNIRLNFVRRFTPGKKLNKYLKYLP